MRFRFLVPTLAAISVVFAVSNPAGAQWINHPTPGIPRTADGKPDLTAPTPRASDGKPDLSGIWADQRARIHDQHHERGDAAVGAEGVRSALGDVRSRGSGRRTACRRVHERVSPDSSRSASFRHHTSRSSCTSRALSARSSATEESCRTIPRRVGWGIPWRVGRETRSSSRRPDTTTGPGSTSPVIRTVRRCA